MKRMLALILALLSATPARAQGPLGYASLPTNWVNSLSAPFGGNNPVFYPASGTYDTTVTLGTSTNVGPNCHNGSSPACGVVYTNDYQGVLDAMENWRDNADNQASASPHFAEKWWFIAVPAGSVLHGSTFDANSALISLPGKINPSPPSGTVSTSGTAVTRTAGTAFVTDRSWENQFIYINGAQYLISKVTDASDLVLTTSAGTQTGVSYSFPEATHGLVIGSTTPLTAGQVVCSHGLPGFGGTRNPGCASPNDKASMWKVQLDSVPSASDVPIIAGQDLVTSSSYANHITLQDVEITIAPGAAQSMTGVHASASLFRAPPNALGTTPPTAPRAPSHIALIRAYIHGWDPGDAGQPTTGSSVDAAGRCLAWYNSGTVNVVNSGATATVTLTSTSPTLAFGNTFFGPTFTAGSTINLGGTYSGGAITGGANYTIAAFDPTTSNTVLTVTTVGGLPATASGVSYLQVNPPSQYATGCGDDVESGVNFNVDYGLEENNYIEKIHWFGGESHGSSFGFDNGPLKITNNWVEGGGGTLFSGGSTVDSQGGPGSDNEIRRNYLGRDLNYRLLSATSANSPTPPWGCGPFDGTASHNTCPFSWDIKNSLEMKMGHRNLIDGNIIENSWADGQSGFCMLINVDAGSGGQAVGIYDPVTGLPRSYIDNIRVSNNWIRNCPQLIQMLNRGDMSPADGGGVTLPVENNDVINNLASNIADTNQFGNPGHQWQWTSGGGNWTCAMSYTGSSNPYTVTASCQPYQTDLTNPNHVSSIVVDGSHNVTIQHNGIRMDPTICQSTPSACVAAGQMVVVNGITGLANGSFAITGAGSTNWASDGTGGTELVYNDSSSPAGTLCNTVTTCGTLITGNTLTFASLGGKLTDISVGDDVYAFNVGGGDTSCASNGYAVGANSATYAIAGTVPTGLTVKYQVATQPSATSANCLVNNGAGFPKYMTVQNNTILAPNVFAITSFNQFYQPISNLFFNNVFADNDPSTKSYVYGESPAGEGTIAFESWDANTFEFYANVLMGRNSSNWSVVNCPGGSCANSFPALTGSFPTGACSNASAPFNCTLMALPWANNFSLSGVASMSISSATQGVNTTQLNTAITQNGYVCPAGAPSSCTPYPDYNGSVTPPTIAPATTIFAQKEPLIYDLQN